eukprot:1433381-Alexandrium_andersonii.AAC.1
MRRCTSPACRRGATLQGAARGQGASARRLPLACQRGAPWQGAARGRRISEGLPRPADACTPGM